MEALVSISVANIAILYKKFGRKKKERFDIILEPLQALIQLAFLSVSPVGTKLTIYNNCLKLQRPSATQGIVRWYNSDNKEDLFYLFNVCKRFPLYYKFLRDQKPELYGLLISMAEKGIEKLIQTYNKTNKMVLLHILQLFKTLLYNPNVIEKSHNILPQFNINDVNESFVSCKSISDNSISSNTSHTLKFGRNSVISSVSSTSTTPTTPTTTPEIKPSVYSSNIELDSLSLNSIHSNEESNENTPFVTGIDKVFTQIISIYNNEEYEIMRNALILLNNCKNNEDITDYIKGTNYLLKPTFSKIQKWISKNIIF